jgi:hypothetical protein
MFLTYFEIVILCVFSVVQIDQGIFPGNLKVSINKPLLRSGEDSSVDTTDKYLFY